MCLMESCQLFSGRTWRCPHSSMARNTTFLLKLLTNDSKDASFFFLAFKMARCQTSFSVIKKFDVEHEFNTKNDRVWSRNGDWFRVVARKQCPTSVMVLAALTESGRSLLFFVDQGVKLIQQNYRDDTLVGALLSWAWEHYKKRPWSFQQDSAPLYEDKKTQ